MAKVGSHRHILGKHLHTEIWQERQFKAGAKSRVKQIPVHQCRICGKEMTTRRRPNKWRWRKVGG